MTTATQASHSIKHLLKIAAPVEQVYEALTTTQGVRHWWTRDADLDSRIGHLGEFRFGSFAPRRITQVEVEDLLPGKLVRWRTLRSHHPEWIGTTISFELEPNGSGTTLRFSHSGFEESSECYALCTTGWAYYLVSLRQYLEEGHGAPSPDVDFSRMLV